MPHNSDLINPVFSLLALHEGLFGQARVFVRAVLLVLSERFAFSKHQVSDVLRAVGLVGEDWRAWYRVFEKPRRFVEEQAGEILLRASLVHVGADEPYGVGVDTPQVWRDSQKMEGPSWLKCGRHPAWNVGIHRVQRFLNGSWLTPLSTGFCRAIPLRFMAAFPDKAVLKAHAACKEWAAGVAFVTWVRSQLNAQGREEQRVLCLADGAYDKPDFWRGLPLNVTVLVRTAKNRALCYFPAPYTGTGRRRTYGDKAPAPSAYTTLRTGWPTAHLTGRGRSPRTVYRVEGPFLRRGMPTVPLLLIVVRGQHYTRYGKTKQRDPNFYLVNAFRQDDLWVLPFPILTLLT